MLRAVRFGCERWFMGDFSIPSWGFAWIPSRALFEPLVADASRVASHLWGNVPGGATRRVLAGAVVGVGDVLPASGCPLRSSLRTAVVDGGEVRFVGGASCGAGHLSLHRHRHT